MNSSWSATTYPDSPHLHIVHMAEDEDGPPWSGTVRLHRGAGSWDGHPELAAAAKSIMVPEAHAGAFVTRPWTFELPERYQGLWNAGESLRYMILRGGSLSWTLTLLFPVRTPLFVYQRVAKAFRATLAAAAPSVKPARKTVPPLAMQRRRR